MSDSQNETTMGQIDAVNVIIKKKDLVGGKSIKRKHSVDGYT